jgi:hypothetical protein
VPTLRRYWARGRERMSYQDLMNNTVIEWCRELDRHNGRWTKRAHELAALSNKYSFLWREEREIV